jgi:hypothetical protein
MAIAAATMEVTTAAIAAGTMAAADITAVAIAGEP